MIPNAKKHVLKNGLTILTEEIPAMRSVAMGILVGAGSSNEANSESGISHFIEHMLFKGTAKRSAFDIAHALDSVGGKMNAYTSKEYTVYYAVVLDKHIDVAMDVLTDMLLNSIFDLEAMIPEKKVVLEEINMYEDTPDELIHDFFTEKILQSHTLGKPIIGNKETVTAISRENMVDYMKKWYCPENTIVSVAGAIPKDLLEQLKKYLENWQGKGLVHPSTPISIKGSLNLKQKKTEQVHLCLGTKGLSQSDDNRYTYSILDNILGGSMSSRLFQEIREKRGLAYSIFSTMSPFKDFGISYVYSGTSKQNLELVVELILKELSSVKKNGVTAEELNKARENIKGSMVLGLESTSSRMGWMQKMQYYYNKIQTIDEIFAKLDKVNLDDIIALANQYYRDEYLTLAVIGDMDKLPITSLSC